MTILKQSRLQLRMLTLQHLMELPLIHLKRVFQHRGLR